MPRASSPLLVIGRGLGRDKPSCQATEGEELTAHKRKLRNKTEEIANLKRSIKTKQLTIDRKEEFIQAQSVTIARLQAANNYLSKTAQSAEN